MPDITSPVSNGELVFTVTSGGALSCFDLRDGKKLWEHDLDMEVQASPALDDNALLMLSTKGDLVAVGATRAFNELNRMKLTDQFDASPAFANGFVYLRGATNLWCLGVKTEE